MRRNTKNSFKSSQRSATIGALMAMDPMITNKEIAELTGCSVGTVIRFLDAVAPGVEVAKIKLAAARGVIRELMPVAERMKRYVEIAQQDIQPAVAYTALQRLDKIDGLDAAIEAEQAEANPQVQPLFSLPAGTSVTVSVQRVEKVVNASATTTSVVDCP